MLTVYFTPGGHTYVIIMLQGVYIHTKTEEKQIDKCDIMYEMYRKSSRSLENRIVVFDNAFLVIEPFGVLL